MTEAVNIAEAKAKLSALVDRAAAGEEIILAKSGRPVARITALIDREPRQPGVARHWQVDNLKIAIVTGEAEQMRKVLASGEPTPISYATPKPEAILEEDRIIEAWPLNLAEERMTTIPVAEAFER